jgi:glycosyltransferase involved in cell wall biosynthesis
MSRRLLFVVNDAGFFLSHRLNIARAVRDIGWEVHVATPPGPAVPCVTAEGFHHHALPLSRSGSNPLAELRSLWTLFRLFRRIRPTLVHAVTIKPVLYSGFVAPWARVPALVQAVSGLGHVFTASGRLAVLRRALIMGAYRFAFRHANSRVILQNQDDREALRQALRAGQAALIPGAGVDPTEFAPRPEPEGEPRVVLASRMLWAKGVGEFVEAARRLRERGVSARFVLVGDPDPGNPAAVPESQLVAWSDSGVVEWWGRREDMPEVFAQAHVVCLPSYREGLPKVLLEAAAAGRAIVTTNVPGCREIVHDGDNGLLVPPRDPAALADALGKLLGNPDLRARMGARGRERVLARFTNEHVIGMTLEVYRELLG